MSRPARELPSPSPVVPALLRWLAGRGVDTAPLAVRFALPDDAADRDELDVTPAMLDDVLATASALVAEPALALRLPAELPFRRYRLGELAARAAPTLRASLRALAPLVHPQLACTLDDTGPDARWHQATPSHPRGVGRHVAEYGIAYALVHARSVLGAALPVRRVWFAHPRPRALAAVERWFGCDDLGFGAADSGFAFDAGHLDRPLVTADPRLAATITELVPAAPARADDLASRVAAHVRARLPEPIVADDAAALLHMSARTLQRRLEAEGTSFSGVVDATREACARELLADPSVPLAEVGYRVGFADLATFSRAFKRWTGTPPGRYRANLPGT